VITRSEPLWRPGNNACAGCGMSLGLQWLDDALRAHAHAGRAGLLRGGHAGGVPDSAYGVPAVASTFASSRPWRPA